MHVHNALEKREVSMDPEACLREIRELTACFIEHDDVDVARLAELVEALDN